MADFENLSSQTLKVFLGYLFYPDDLTLVSNAPKGLKERTEPWKETLESKVLRVNVEKKKMMISTENADKITEERKFSCVVCREGLGSNFRFAGVACIWDAVA